MERNTKDVEKTRKEDRRFTYVSGNVLRLLLTSVKLFLSHPQLLGLSLQLFLFAKQLIAHCRRRIAKPRNRLNLQEHCHRIVIRSFSSVRTIRTYIVLNNLHEQHSYCEILETEGFEASPLGLCTQKRGDMRSSCNEKRPRSPFRLIDSAPRRLHGRLNRLQISADLSQHEVFGQTLLTLSRGTYLMGRNSSCPSLSGERIEAFNVLPSTCSTWRWLLTCGFLNKHHMYFRHDLCLLAMPPIQCADYYSQSTSHRRVGLRERHRGGHQ